LAPHCGTQMVLPATQLGQHRPRWWPPQGPKLGPKQVPEVAPPWLRPREQQHTAAQQGSGCCSGQGTGSKASAPCPNLLGKDRAPSAVQPGFLLGTAAGKEPLPQQAPQHSVPDTAGAAKQEGSQWRASSDPRMGCPSLYQGRKKLPARTAAHEEPIPAQVPQPCWAQGLVAHLANKVTAVCPAASVTHDTALHPNCSC